MVSNHEEHIPLSDWIKQHNIIDESLLSFAEGVAGDVEQLAQLLCANLEIIAKPEIEKNLMPIKI